MKPGKAGRSAPPASGSPPPESVRPKRGTGAPMFNDEETRQVDPNMPLPSAAGRPLRRGPERIADDFRLDDPTRHADVDPRLLASSGGLPYDEDATRAASVYPGADDAMTLDELDVDFLSATHQGDGIDGSIDLGPREQSRKYPKLEDEDATKMGDMRDLLSRERNRGAGAGATSRKKPETREPPRPGAPAGRGQRGSDPRHRHRPQPQPVRRRLGSRLMGFKQGLIAQDPWENLG